MADEAPTRLCAATVLSFYWDLEQKYWIDRPKHKLVFGSLRVRHRNEDDSEAEDNSLSLNLNPEQERKFATGGRTKVPLYVTGVVKVDDAKVAVHEGNIVESEKKYVNKKDFNMIVTCTMFD
ncbi:hypothetical protein L1987_34560 [Smallanthus sonchifolius]|uniref:Uncharacterized protein n=1 Tax=Smallanthus sonchifolius TaxID=185202 RepID=A0ACB9HTV5_9ASTR|nr:hypothetical protein L1987_34560 [Smallanthus sonchifolius]